MPVPGADEVLLRVKAAAVCRGDTFLQAGKPYLVRVSGHGLLRPRARVPGQSVSGEVIAVGEGVRDIAPGDMMFGEIPSGAFAEFAAARAELLATKPAGLSHGEAAALALSGITALQGLRDAGRVGDGDSVLVNGASGAVGTLAIQIAKALGASVTAVCSTRHLQLVRALGADHTIDYTRADFTHGEARYDCILDLVANRALRDCSRITKPGGRFVAAAIPAGANWIGPVTWMAKLAIAGATSGNKHAMLMAKPNRADLAVLARMADEGHVKPVIERRCVLDETANAYAHVARGRARGATVVEVAHD
ncbi:MAG: NAD(P)-dependent alcohol dehydrogenase [Hyphomicrobiaceae bacterium]|nr:NAD(P)-dependent alcohol dehydrogenase [Hyphomicrobiaceae bacterium]